MRCVRAQMNTQEQQILNQLLERLQRVNAGGEARDPQLERWIAQSLQQNPDATYRLVQTLLKQEQALRHARQRLQRTARWRKWLKLYYSLKPVLNAIPSATNPFRDQLCTPGRLSSLLSTILAIAGGILAGGLLANMLGIGDELFSAGVVTQPPTMLHETQDFLQRFNSGLAAPLSGGHDDFI